jgi:hypothetical protein
MIMRGNFELNSISVGNASNEPVRDRATAITPACLRKRFALPVWSAWLVAEQSLAGPVTGQPITERRGVSRVVGARSITIDRRISRPVSRRAVTEDDCVAGLIGAGPIGERGRISRGVVRHAVVTGHHAARPVAVLSVGT